MDVQTIIQFWQDWVEKQKGSDKFILNPDKQIVLDVATGILDNEKNKGFKYCPCRLPVGEKLKDLELICPCNFKIQETWKNKGECWCSLFIKEKNKNGIVNI